MQIIQLTGLSGAGKTTIANEAARMLSEQGWSLLVIDGDVFRKTQSSDLGFTKADRCENIRRMACHAVELGCTYDIIIISAINPYEHTRLALKDQHGAKTVFINCTLKELIARDTKGLYARALLPDGHADKLNNFSGINDPFEHPSCAELIINTHLEEVNTSAKALCAFSLALLSANGVAPAPRKVRLPV